MANANETTPAKTSAQGTLQRFRVNLVERHFYSLDVLARTENDAAGIAMASSEWWLDEDEGDSHVSFIEPLDPEDTTFSPPEGTCKGCGQTLVPYEQNTCETCDDLSTSSRSRP